MKSHLSKNIKRAFLALSAMALLLPSVATTGTLTGQVTDQADGLGLFSATIVVRAVEGDFEARMTSADDEGSYTFEDLPAGEYIVKISYVGFAPDSSMVRVGSDGSASHDVALLSSLVNVRAIAVTASRGQEKVLEAPASVSVVSEEDIAVRPALTPTEHVKGLPGVDVATTGLAQSNMVVRGFNNIFSGAMLVLVDNRIARVPSLRFNAHQFISTTNEDIARIEIVSGPGSALYGANSATGVLHIISKSPFGSQGTTISLGGGERELFLGSFRHAGTSSNNRIGYKISGQYYQGLDWKSSDALEPDSITPFRPTSTGPDTVGAIQANTRNFDIEKYSGEGRVDFILDENTSLIVNGGFNRATDIELTGLGAGQAINWTYWYTQARFKYKDLFIQAYVNASDAGDTYLLRSGQLIVDQSKLWAGQIQHRYRPSEKISLTYGFDATFTRPQTDGTINGRNEDKDEINEFGVYVQADYILSEKFKLVGAARIDDNSELENAVVSPRAALVFKPNENNNFRATYNRAYQTPDNNNLFLDILQAPDPFAEVIGFSPGIDIRVQGVPETGFSWSFDTNGNPRFRSFFADRDPRGLTSSDYIDFNDPIFTNVMWGVGSFAVQAGFKAQLEASIPDSATVAFLTTALNSLTPSFVFGVNNALMRFDIDDETFVPDSIAGISDIGRMKSTITQTFELGYKGILADRFQISVDIYATTKDNFIGPLTIETPNVFLDPATLQANLQTQFDSLVLANPVEAGALVSVLDANGDGMIVDELIAMYMNTAQIPFGTVTPSEAFDPTAILVTYRNFGDVTFYGSDIALNFHVNRNFDIGGTYSYVSRNFFKKGGTQVHDILLNAPKHKIGLHARYTNQSLGLNVQSRLRWVDAFEMAGPFVGTTVNSYSVVDLNIDWRFMFNTRLSFSIQNLLDKEHIEFVGAPKLGRLTIARITQTF